jgi:CRP-like cAMP-binding protein
MTVYSEKEGRERELASIEAPAVIGELEAFTGDPRSACVRARTEVKAVELSFETLRSRLISGDPAAVSVIFHTARTIARRLTAMNRKFVELQQQPGVRHDDLREFQEKLFNDWTM